MNLVGKIFTVLILVMSVLFMAFAMSVYATHKNWKLLVDNADATKGPQGYLQVLKDKEKLNTDLSEKLGQTELAAKREKDSLVQVNGKVEAENVKLVDELKTTKDNMVTADTKLRTALAEVDKAHASMKLERDELEKLRADVRKAEQDRDAIKKELVKNTDEMHQAANELARAHADNVRVSEELSKAKQVLDKFGKKAEPELYKDVAPVVDGIVAAVTGNDLVEISVGADCGLLPGHQLEVSRVSGGVLTYVGRIEVIKTAPDRSVCKIIRSFMRSDVQKGDRVDTKQK